MSKTTPNHADRAHALLSASSAERWLNCQPSAVAAEAYPNEGTEFTREGTLAHEVAELYARGDRTGPANEITQEMIDCAIGYRDYIQELTKSDDAIVLLEQRVDFSPWVPDGFGTCDCILIQGDTLTIIDYKYGVGVAVSAVDNPQMKLYALGALNDYGIAMDVNRVEMHIYQPRINNISDCSLMVEDLMEWAENTVKPAAENACRGKGEYNAGSWCKFCPHAGRCRQLTQICTEYVETHSLRAAVPVLAPHEVAEVLAMEPLVTLWLKRVKSQALTTLLDDGEIPGYKVVEGRASRNWADELEVAQELERRGFSREDYTKTEVLSVAQMEKALGKTKVAEVLSGHILKTPGAPTVVPASDKRPTYSRADEFEKLD